MAGLTQSLNLSVATALIVERALARAGAALGAAGRSRRGAQLRLRARFYAALGARRRRRARALSGVALTEIALQRTQRT